MEPITFLIKAVTVACIAVFPIQPSTVPGTVEIVHASNTSVISDTADKIEAERIAAEKKAAAEKKVAEEKAAAEKKAAEEKAAAEKKAKEEAEVEALKKVAEKEKLHLPLDPGTYTYTSDYGPRCAPVAGAGDFHYGIDLAASLGTPIYALADGTVKHVQDGTSGGQAGMVFIESTIDDKQITYSYAHMGNSSQYVKVGDKVKAGDHVSDVASTGMSTGAHLHIEIWEGEMNTGKRINPVSYFTAIGLDVIDSATANYVSPTPISVVCNPVTKEIPVIAASNDSAETPAETTKPTTEATENSK